MTYLHDIWHHITWGQIPTPDFDPTLDLRSVLAPIISVLALILRSSVEIY